MDDFEALYQTYFQDVYRFMLRLSGDAYVAEEITSQTFLKALEAIDGFRGTCSLRVWLCQIAKNLYFSHRRRLKKLVPLEAVNPPETHTVDEHLLQCDQAAQISRILHELPEVNRDVFLWRVFAELSFREIGRLCGRTDNWACVTFHRTRGMIQKRLEEEQHEA